MSEQEALLTAIRENTDDDTLRLAYADWLQEQEPVRVKCPNCSYADVPVNRRTCQICSGSGAVLDTSNADRAAFIRLSIALGE